jgi:hypothetical protein
MNSISFNSRKASRRLTVTRCGSMLHNGKVYERYIDHAYICIEGPHVDYAGAQPSENIPEKAKEFRQRRDGIHHHITSMYLLPIVCSPLLSSPLLSSPLLSSTISDMIQHYNPCRCLCLPLSPFHSPSSEPF